MSIVQLTASQGVIIQRRFNCVDVRRLPPPHSVLVEMGSVLQKVEIMGGIVDEPRVKVEANRDEMILLPALRALIPRPLC